MLMNKMDSGRVVLGGIVAGIICDIFEYVMNEIIVFNVLGLVTGIAAVWGYAAMRPRFGAGPKTATYAALLIWVVGYLIPDVFQVVSGLVPLTMMVTMVVVGLVEIIVATVAGAYLYKEPGEGFSPAVAH
jgi:NhaP-type Na+/H+ or K+/H+ antiporter